MADLPDYFVIYEPARPPQFADFPHSLTLRPSGENDFADGTVTGCFLIDRECGFDVLNGAALADYIKQRVPVHLHAQRARDLRPFLRRASAFAARGYSVEVWARRA